MADNRGSLPAQSLSDKLSGCQEENEHATIFDNYFAEGFSTEFRILPSRSISISTTSPLLR